MPAARAAAIAAGETYYQGALCRAGHSGLRFSGNGGKCVECVRLRHDRWRSQNPDYPAKDWQKNKTRYQQRAAELKSSDPARWKEVRAAINARHRDKRVEESKQWHELNKDRAKAYRQERRDLYATHARNRRAFKAQSEGQHTQEQLDGLLIRQRSKCANCRSCIKAARHADHIMPLALGGSNDISNMQWLCPRCNLSKNAKHPIKFAQLHGRLL